MFFLACSPPPPSPLHQWVWSDADLPVLAEARRREPAMIAGIHIASVTVRNGALVNELALSPSRVEAPVAMVIRIEDPINPLWDTDPELAQHLDQTLGRLMALLHSEQRPYTELQLDYDVPVRRLSAWAETLKLLRRSSLAGEHLWVTSLVAHLQTPEYGSLLSGKVDGHILQVFDTGDQTTEAGEVRRLTERAGLPYRLGVGAFERVQQGTQVTQHRAWFSHLSEACVAPRCEGVWVFPAGRSYLELLAPHP